MGLFVSFPQEVVKLRTKEKFLETKYIIKIMTLYLTLPLYLLFWFCDIIYVPHLKWEFLAMRFSIIPFLMAIYFVNERVKTFKGAQWNALALVFVDATFINLMIIFYLKGGVSPYYAGLNLVTMGTIAFFPWSIRFIWAPILAIYAPFYIGILVTDPSELALKLLWTNSFFIVGAVTISVVIRFYNERLLLEEAGSRVALNKELSTRDKVIIAKTEEAVSLTQLSQQFSPQVVDAIKKGRLQLESSIHQAEICTIFVDIVNSTERVTRIGQKNLDKVISMFMEDTIKIMLKYDITVDKFLGDGVLAFSNDPVPYHDFSTRVVRAALEIQERVRQRASIYENYWMNELKLCIGIATGSAHVGFYGNSKYFHSYTAIGPVVNLASRLCGACEPNQILISHQTLESLDLADFEFEFAGKKVLKGFESDIIKTYVIKEYKNLNNEDWEVKYCPNCETILHMKTNDRGIYHFGCRDCDYSDLDVATKPSWAQTS